MARSLFAFDRLRMPIDFFLAHQDRIAHWRAHSSSQHHGDDDEETANADDEHEDGHNAKRMKRMPRALMWSSIGWYFLHLLKQQQQHY